MPSSTPVNAGLPPARENALLWMLAGVQFSHIVDFMIMMPLGPILMLDLKFDTHAFGLLVSVYTFAAAASGVLAASYIDRFERKRLLLTIFGLFILATAACGLAWSYWSLLLARTLAGAFGGVLGAMVLTMVADLVPFERRGRASGIIMSAFSLATVAGVPLSLLLANQFGWRAPFFFIALLSCGLWWIGQRGLPELRAHLRVAKPGSSGVARALAMYGEVLRDPNHRRALTFAAATVFSAFLVIPYITLYNTANMKIAQADIPLLYLAGGCATFISARLIGRFADRHGKIGTYRVVALLSLVPLLLQTHIGAVPLWAALACSTLFFILVPGRMVPGMAIIASAAQPAVRGTFMAIHAALQQLASGVASLIAGLIITRDASGLIMRYDWVGYLAVATSLAAIWLVARVSVAASPPGAQTLGTGRQ